MLGTILGLGASHHFQKWLNNSAKTIGKAYSNAAQAEVNSARAYNTSEREAAQQYQTEMSNTAYSRAGKDLESMGLNPALVAFGGSAASSPASSGASSAGVDYTNALNSSTGLIIKGANLARNIFKDGMNAATSVAKLFG